MDYDIEARVEGARARLDAQIIRAQEARAALDAGLEQIRESEATVRSPRGECIVTALADGSITAVRFNQRAELGATTERVLVATIAAAQRAAREAAADRAALVLGESSPLVTALRPSNVGHG